VFGISDGLVSNVSLILGFAGGNAGAGIVRLAGIAGAVAGAASMAAGEWVSVSAQNELIQRELEAERHELLNNTEHETLELATFYEGHGMSAANAAIAAREVMADPERAMIVHAREELGIDPSEMPSALGAAVVSFLCFVMGALLPVIPWYLGSGTAATVASIAIGAVAAAVVGGLIGRFAERPILRTASRQVAIALVACGVTYLIGTLFDITVV
jgi:predicted membrane protein (TIGR00267 family)